MSKGTCRVCGCTQERACKGGCRWIDDDKNLCDACIEQFVVATEVTDGYPIIVIDSRIGTIPGRLKEIIEGHIVSDFTGASINWHAVWEEYFNDHS